MSPPGTHALIVGGARGIGRVTAERLIARGVRPLVADRDEAELEKRQATWGPSGETLRMDLTNRDDVRRAIGSIKERGAPLDAVIVTAAVHGSCPVEYLPDEVIDRIMNVNFGAHVRFVRDVIPLIGKGGRIIAISSLSAGVGIPMQSIYSASKAALELFYESLSLELAYKAIRCVIIQPGNVNTGFNETGNDYRPGGNPHLDDMYRKVVARIDSRYGMDPERVADTIVEAMFARNPKLCYVVGGNAIKVHWLKRLLGRDLTLLVLKRAMGL